MERDLVVGILVGLAAVAGIVIAAFLSIAAGMWFAGLQIWN